MYQTGVYGTASRRQASMNGDFASDAVTSGIVSHHRAVTAGGHAVRGPTAERMSVPLSASTPCNPGKPGDGARHEEVARMTELSRYCAGCGEEFHAKPALCPDAPDGDCPEWACAVCGDAFIIGPLVREQASSDRSIRAA
jgi:hypothetical protein